LFLTDPLYGSVFIPGQVKAIMVAAFAAALALWVPVLPPLPSDPSAVIYQGFMQLTYGAVLGLTMQIAVLAIACMGEIAGSTMGLGFAETAYKEATTETPVLYDIMTWAGLMAYIAVGGPVWLFGALAHSFQHGIALDNLANWNQLTMLGSSFMTTAVWLAMPVLAVTLSINISVGLTSVFAPQMNILTIGFPLLILAGMWILIGSVGYLNHDFQQIFLASMHAVMAMMPHG
jgi:flagellar biosynthetic protein FliR